MGGIEIWLYREGHLTIKALQTAGYTDVEKSIALPIVTVVQLNEWINLRKTGTDLTVMKAVRANLEKKS